MKRKDPPVDLERKRVAGAQPGGQGGLQAPQRRRLHGPPTEQKARLAMLPDDLLQELCSHFDLQDHLCMFALVCREFHQVSTHHASWPETIDMGGWYATESSPVFRDLSQDYGFRVPKLEFQVVSRGMFRSLSLAETYVSNYLETVIVTTGSPLVPASTGQGSTIINLHNICLSNLKTLEFFVPAAVTVVFPADVSALHGLETLALTYACRDFGTERVYSLVLPSLQRLSTRTVCTSRLLSCGICPNVMQRLAIESSNLPRLSSVNLYGLHVKLNVETLCKSLGTVEMLSSDLRVAIQNITAFGHLIRNVRDLVIVADKWLNERNGPAEYSKMESLTLYGDRWHQERVADDFIVNQIMTIQSSPILKVVHHPENLDIDQYAKMRPDVVFHPVEWDRGSGFGCVGIRCSLGKECKFRLPSPWKREGWSV